MRNKLYKYRPRESMPENAGIKLCADVDFAQKYPRGFFDKHNVGPVLPLDNHLNGCSFLAEAFVTFTVEKDKAMEFADAFAKAHNDTLQDMEKKQEDRIREEVEKRQASLRHTLAGVLHQYAAPAQVEVLATVLSKTAGEHEVAHRSGKAEQERSR